MHRSRQKVRPASSAASQPAAEQQKPVLLVVSFGTSYNDTRDKTIGAVEESLAKAYPEYEIRRRLRHKPSLISWKSERV